MTANIIIPSHAEGEGLELRTEHLEILRVALQGRACRRYPGTTALALLLLLVSIPLLAATPRPYHLELEANPAAPFPFLGRFGTVSVHVYGGGVRAESIWLRGFSRNRTSAVTVENPIGRMYTDVPIAEIAAIMGKLDQKGDVAAGATLSAPVHGKVHGIDAMRYRLTYGPTAWIDVWTTKSLPDSPQFRAIVKELVKGISPSTAAVAGRIPGLPIQVELNFSHYPKLTILKVKSLKFDNAGEEEALKTGTLYMRAPLLDSIWK